MHIYDFILIRTVLLWNEAGFEDCLRQRKHSQAGAKTAAFLAVQLANEHVRRALGYSDEFFDFERASSGEIYPTEDDQLPHLMVRALATVDEAPIIKILEHPSLVMEVTILRGYERERADRFPQFGCVDLCAILDAALVFGKPNVILALVPKMRRFRAQMDFSATPNDKTSIWLRSLFSHAFFIACLFCYDDVTMLRDALEDFNQTFTETSFYGGISLAILRAVAFISVVLNRPEITNLLVTQVCAVA